GRVRQGRRSLVARAVLRQCSGELSRRVRKEHLHSRPRAVPQDAPRLVPAAPSAAAQLVEAAESVSRGSSGSRLGHLLAEDLRGAGMTAADFDPASAAIVIVTFNRSHLLSGLLTSIRSMDPKPGRVVVIDNASSDDTTEVVDSFRSDIGTEIVYRRLES